MSLRNLTKQEKKRILSKIDKPISTEIERVLESVTVPENFREEDVDLVKEKLDSYLLSELPRKLTKREIDNIVSVIPKLPCSVGKIADFNIDIIRNMMRKQLSYQKFLVKKGTIDKIKEIIYEVFLRSSLAAGSSVGSTGGMALSEKITQAMLDAIHSGGGKNQKDSNFKLVTELIEIGKEKHILKFIVHFKDKNLVPEEIIVLGEMLKGVSVADFVQSTEILDSVPEEDWRYYKNYSLIHNQNIDPAQFKTKFLRLNIDINKCFMYDTMIEELIDIIKMNTEDEDFDQTVICVGSPLKRGFIDIHGTKEYIEYSVTQFSNLGKRIGECSSVKPDPDQPEELSDLDLDEMSGIFLKVILEDCLVDMKVKGMNGVHDVIPSQTIDMEETFMESYVIDTEKYSDRPLEEIKRLWNININREHLYFEGVTIEKIRRMFEVCGIEIIEDLFENEGFGVVMMPKKRNEKLYNEEGEVKYKYVLRDGKYYENDEEGKEFPDNKYNPARRISDLRQFEKEILSRKIISYRETNEEEFLNTLPEFSDIYRATTYTYAFIEGFKITRDLFSSKIIDKRYLFPENTRAVKDIFGIEGARFYLIKKYLSISFVKKLNPCNVFLLADFQTYSGTLIPIKSRQIYKQGNSVLAEASFEQQSTVFKNASAFGENDDITSVGSRIITGIPCKNGTGSVDLTYDPFYLSNDENKVEEQVKKEDSKMFNDDVMGPCLNAGHYVLPKESLDAESVDLPERADPVVCSKQKVPTPPRSDAPSSMKKRRSRHSTIFRGDRINIDSLDEIPDEPDFDEDEFLQ